MSDRNPLAYTGLISASTTVQGDAQFNPAQFSVTDGVVSLAGGGLAVDSLAGDSGSATPTASGVITVAGGTNITTAGATNTLTVNLDAAISLATSVTSPLYLAPAATDMAITSTAGQDIIIKMGDAAGANFISFTDTGDSEVASLDSNGAFTALGDIITSRSAAAVEVTIEVTNSDNTDPSSDAFFEAAVGGTGSGNPGIRFQISGGQNYAMGIDNASGNDDLLIGGDNDIGTDTILRIAEAGDVTLEKGNLVLNTEGSQIQMQGGAVTDFIGTATLVAGTVTIANTNIAAGDRIFIQRQSINGSTALGLLTYSVSAATSFTITSVQAAIPASTETNDVSIVTYHIIREI